MKTGTYSMGVIICHSLNALKRLSINYLMLTGGHKKGNKGTDEDEKFEEEEGMKMKSLMKKSLDES